LGPVTHRRDPPMHPAVYRVFEEICSQAAIRGRVLEVGAVPGPDSLLRIVALRNAEARVGLNLEGSGCCGGYEIVKGNANAMTCFDDDAFAAVLCNATLEHDRCFWKTIAEIHRVTASGGLIAIGVPGYAGMGPDTFAPADSWFGRFLRWFARGPYADVIAAGTVTLGVHNFPGDYYRFSEQAIREVFLAGLMNVAVRHVLNPPRIIAWGRKP
jgi:SAM-dependent methyltransferase